MNHVDFFKNFAITMLKRAKIINNPEVIIINKLVLESIHRNNFFVLLKYGGKQ